MKFTYCMELKEGYTPTMEEKEIKEIEFVIEAKNRATADRAAKALLKGANNIKIHVCTYITD